MALSTPSATAIVNSALARLGCLDRVTSLDSTVPGVGDSARAVWDEQLRRLLADHPWNGFIARALLNEGAAPVAGYARAFALPADCLRWLPWSDEDADWFEGEVEGGMILTDAEAPLAIRYISAGLAEAVAKWPAWFEQAMIAALADVLAYSITQSQSVADRMAMRFDEALAKAKRKDGLESGRRRRRAVPVRSDWLSARGQTYYPGGR